MNTGSMMNAYAKNAMIAACKGFALTQVTTWSNRLAERVTPVVVAVVVPTVASDGFGKNSFI